MKISKREDYGVILITELFRNFEKKVVPLAEVAQKHQIPLLFLRNIARDLRRAGLIRAVEGRNGGYRLAKNPREIKFGEVIEALAKKPIFSCCQSTPDGRCVTRSCPSGFSLRKLNNQFLEKIYSRKLNEVLVNVENPKS